MNVTMRSFEVPTVTLGWFDSGGASNRQLLMDYYTIKYRRLFSRRCPLSDIRFLFYSPKEAITYLE
jgi:hypothetical protein